MNAASSMDSAETPASEENSEPEENATVVDDEGSCSASHSGGSGVPWLVMLGLLLARRRMFARRSF